MDVDETGEGTDVHVRKARVRSREEARLRRRPASPRRRVGRRGAPAPARGRHPPPAARGAPRRREPAAARAGGRERPGRVRAVLPRAVSGRGVERADLAHDRDGRGGADARRARSGILRTVPPRTRRGSSASGRTAKALGVPWPKEMSYPAFVRDAGRERAPAGGAPRRGGRPPARLRLHRLRPARSRGTPSTPPLASTYAHTTAPLRRLVDRYVGETCIALSEGRKVPGVGRVRAARRCPT